MLFLLAIGFVSAVEWFPFILTVFVDLSYGK